MAVVTMGRILVVTIPITSSMGSCHRHGGGGGSGGCRWRNNSWKAILIQLFVVTYTFTIPIAFEGFLLGDS